MKSIISGHNKQVLNLKPKTKGAIVETKIPVHLIINVLRQK